MRDFTYHRPSTLADAVSLLKSAPEGKYLAGGQSLIPILKLDLAQPSDLVSLAGVKDLHGIRVEGRELVVGAGSTHAEAAASAEVRKAILALAHLAGEIGDPQVRNRGTLGGSIAHADPAADYPAALLGLGATVVTERRRIAADDFFTGIFQTALAPDEIVTAVRFPIPDRAAYAKFPNPASRFAIVGVFVAKGAQGVRVAVTGAGTRVFRSAEMEKALSGRFDGPALTAIRVPTSDLVSDLHAGAEYRAHLVGVMARRAVAACG
jgi:carbon-monoxide dehydrogenase medium subunit